MAMNPIRNEGGLTLRDLGAETDVGANVAVDRAGRLIITGSSSAVSVPINSTDITATGNLDMTTTSSLVVSVNGMASVTLLIVRTAQTGTLQMQGSVDGGTTWLILSTLTPNNNPGVYYREPQSGASSINIAVANGTGTYETPCQGYNQVRVVVAVTGTGSLPAYLRASQSQGPWVQGVFPGTSPFALGKAEDAPSSSGDVGVFVLSTRNDNLVAQQTSTNADYQALQTDVLGALWVRTGEIGNATHTQPSVITATSTVILASNTGRRSFMIQNNTAANIMINLANGTLTGIVPTATNIGIVLTAGSSYSSPVNTTTTAAITAYQTSGGTVNTISVTEY